MFTEPQRQRIAVETRVQMALSLINRATAECGWTYDALEQHTGKGRSYLHRVLNGTQKCTLEFYLSLPDDIRRRVTELAAERSGFYVVDAARAENAAKQLALFMLGMVQKAQPAKANLRDESREIEVA